MYKDFANTLWVNDVIGSRILRLNQAGTVLANFSTAFQPADLVVDNADSSLWVVARNTPTVHHLSPTGTPLGSFTFTTATPGAFGGGIAQAADGTLWLMNEGSTAVVHYTQSGTLIGTIVLPPDLFETRIPLFLTIVPGSLNAIIPEPSSFSLLALGAIGLFRVRRRKPG